MVTSAQLEQLMVTGAASFPLLLAGAAKGFIVLVMSSLAALGMRSASAAARHLVWFLGIVGLLGLPLLSAALPGLYILPAGVLTDVLPLQAAPAPVTPPPVRPSPLSPPTSVQMAEDGPAFSVDTSDHLRTGASDAPVAPQGRVSAAALPPIAPIPEPSSQVTASALSHLSWQAWLVLAWVLVAGSLIIWTAMGWLSLWVLQLRSVPVQDQSWTVLLDELRAQLQLRRPVVLLTSPLRAMPMIWGWWRARLLLPAGSEDWSSEQRRAVLLHELAHVRRWDCLTQAIAQLACALHWFNPLVWLAWRQMQAERERACDDLVLSTGARASVYAEQLLRIASGLPMPPCAATAIAMARPSMLEGRLVAILDVTRNRSRLAAGSVLLGILLLSLTVTPLAALRARTADAAPAAPASVVQVESGPAIATRPSASTRSPATRPAEQTGTVIAVHGSSAYGNDLGYSRDLYRGALSRGESITLLSPRVMRNEFDIPVVKVKARHDGLLRRLLAAGGNKIVWVTLADTSFADRYDPATDSILAPPAVAGSRPAVSAAPADGESGFITGYAALFGSDVAYAPQLYLGSLNKGDKIILLERRVVADQRASALVKVQTASQSEYGLVAGRIGWVPLQATTFIERYDPTTRTILSPVSATRPEQGLAGQWDAMTRATQPAGDPLAGVVRLQDDSAASSASIYPAWLSSAFFVAEKNHGRDPAAVPAVTDVQGRFIWPAVFANAPALFISHARGYAWITREQLQESAEVKLSAWGRLEGSIWNQGKPGGPDDLLLQFQVKFRPSPVLPWDLEPVMTGPGRFVYERLPACRLTVCRPARESMTHYPFAQGVRIQAGETAHVDLGGSGRPVVGRLLIPPGVELQTRPGRYPSQSMVRLHSKPPFMDQLASMNEQQMSAWAADPKNLAALQQFEDASRWHAAALDSEGRFRFDDVAPGAYLLMGGLTLSDSRPGAGAAPFHVQPRLRDVVVDEVPGGRSDEPLNIGDVRVKTEDVERPASTTQPVSQPTNGQAAPLAPADGPKTASPASRKPAETERTAQVATSAPARRAVDSANEIAGRVVDHENNPLAGAVVFAPTLSEAAHVYISPGKVVEPSHPDRAKGSQATTDADGYFTLLRPSQAAGFLLVTAPRYLAWLVPSVKTGQETLIALPKPAAFRIRYSVPGGPEIGDFWVALRTHELPEWKERLYNAHVQLSVPNGGEATVGILPPGIYDIQRRKQAGNGNVPLDWPNRFELTAGETKTVDFIRRGIAIQGTVVGLRENALSGATISVTERQPVRARPLNQLRQFDFIATGSGGRFQTETLPPGEYTMTAGANWSTPSLGGDRVFAGQLDITVPAAVTGDFPPVTIQLKDNGLDARIAQLIEELGSSHEQTRSNARELLWGLGQRAIPALQKSVQAGSPAAPAARELLSRPQADSHQ